MPYVYKLMEAIYKTSIDIGAIFGQCSQNSTEWSGRLLIL